MLWWHYIALIFILALMIYCIYDGVKHGFDAHDPLEADDWTVERAIDVFTVTQELPEGINVTRLFKALKELRHYSDLSDVNVYPKDTPLSIAVADMINHIEVNYPAAWSPPVWLVPATEDLRPYSQLMATRI